MAKHSMPNDQNPNIFSDGDMATLAMNSGSAVNSNEINMKQTMSGEIA